MRGIKKIPRFAIYCACGARVEIFGTPMYETDKMVDIFKRHMKPDCKIITSVEYADMKKKNKQADKLDDLGCC